MRWDTGLISEQDEDSRNQIREDKSLMEGIKSWIVAEGTGHWFFVAFPVCLLILFIWFKGRRVRFLIPSLLISLLLVNPWFYEKWTELGMYAYWRILWIVPVIPVVASLVPMISEKFGNKWIKGLLVGVGVFAIILGGTFVYKTDRGQFVEAANADKVPGYAAEIADKLLELKNKPRVIAQDPIGVYIRQYSGEIDTLYGRDIHGHIHWPRDDAKSIYNAVSTGEWELVNQYMLDDEYDFLVISGDADNSSLELVDTIANYGIYKASGKPQVIKQRNSLGQVMSATTVDTDGQPLEKDGYTTKEYEYDGDGNVSLEIHRNVDNAEQFVSACGNDYIACGVRAAYDNMRLTYEAYYDDEGKFKVQPAGYVAIEQEWDDKGNLLSRSYLDEHGQPMNRIDGYSKAIWAPDEKGVWSVSFYDVEGTPVLSHGLNLIRDEKIRNGEWTEWMTPDPNTDYSLFTIDNIILDNKEMGDYYTCQIEIEFLGVTEKDDGTFGFWTQGTTDGAWNIGNIWWRGIWLKTPPDNGIFQYSFSSVIDTEMQNASEFKIGFRCDNWSTGCFRVRKIKIEKGETASKWSPGL